MQKIENVTHPGLDVATFQEAIKGTPCHLPALAPLLQNIKDAKDQNDVIRQICIQLRTFNPKNFEEYLWLHRLTCATFLLKSGIENRILQTDLLHYSYTLEIDDWETCPIRIHKICKEIYSLLSDDMNLICYCRKIYPISNMGSYISLALFWALYLRIKNIEIEMFRFRKMKTLVTLLPRTSEIIQNLPLLHKILQVISFMQNAILLKSKSSPSHSTRFKHYFECSPEDEKLLVDWCDRLSLEFSCKYPNMINNASELCQVKELLENDIRHNFPDTVTTIPIY